MGEPRAIQTLNQLMEMLCLRRKKEVLLNLPRKVEHVIRVTMGNPWESFYREFHDEFIQSFGRLQTPGQAWNSSEFFTQLMRIRVYCNHPILAREELLVRHQLNNWTWRWQDSAKIVHLIDHLRRFLRGDKRGICRPKAVIFSLFVSFLEM
jgi:SNF2 family DNA or RNA helicase